MTAIIFGSGGQDGYYLNKLLLERGISTVGITRNLNRIGSGHCADVSNFSAVRSIISITKPKYIFNLAANSTTRHDALFENHSTISTGTLNILEAVRKHCPTAKVFITGSAVQFKNEGFSIDESSPFEASSPYSIARIQSVYAARYYRSLGIQAYVGYLFHHESPLRQPNHISKMIVSAANRIANGSNEILTLGDTSVVKEWAFAGDVVRAMFDLVRQDTVFEAVIGTGEGHSIQEWIELCFDMAGYDWRNYIVQREGFCAEYKKLISNPSVINSIGWHPEVSFVDLAKMMWNHG